VTVTQKCGIAARHCPHSTQFRYAPDGSQLGRLDEIVQCPGVDPPKPAPCGYAFPHPEHANCPGIERLPPVRGWDY
jgi:hypothetical protein